MQHPLQHSNSAYSELIYIKQDFPILRMVYSVTGAVDILTVEAW